MKGSPVRVRASAPRAHHPRLAGGGAALMSASTAYPGLECKGYELVSEQRQPLERLMEDARAMSPGTRPQGGADRRSGRSRRSGACDASRRQSGPAPGRPAFNTLSTSRVSRCSHWVTASLRNRARSNRFSLHNAGQSGCGRRLTREYGPGRARSTATIRLAEDAVASMRKALRLGPRDRGFAARRVLRWPRSERRGRG